MTGNDAETLLAETCAFNAELERLLATMPSVHTVPPQETRRARREGRGIFPAPVFLPEARTIEIAGPSGNRRAPSFTSTVAGGRWATPTGRTRAWPDWRARPGLASRGGGFARSGE